MFVIEKTEIGTWMILEYSFTIEEKSINRCTDRVLCFYNDLNMKSLFSLKRKQLLNVRSSLSLSVEKQQL